MSNIESQGDPLQDTRSHKSLQKQLLCAFVINLVSLLQLASVSTSSIILHSLQNNHSEKVSFSDIRGNYTSTSHSSNISKSATSTKNILFEDFCVTEDSGSWIGRKISTKKKTQCFFSFSKLAAGFLVISSLPFSLGL